jgi:hypothetical protein
MNPNPINPPPRVSQDVPARAEARRQNEFNLTNLTQPDRT